jgi:DMSO/TMAO reductase YedYZ heme-binding membrane subunit
VFVLATAAAVTATGPSWYWYATRGLGVSTLVVLTLVVVLGIVTAVRWIGDATPGFVAAELHRNLSLLAMALLAAHIITTVLDPFAHISVRDVFIPVGAGYRPIWLGLGVVAMEVLVGVAASSLLRDRVGVRTWRVIHWTAYLSWPLSVVHGIGTGSDVKAPWMIGVVAGCVVAVLLALNQRLRHGPVETIPVRAMAGVVTATMITIVGIWAFGGPMQDGWAAKAGTPPVKTKVAVAKPGPVHPGPGGFSDPLTGVMVRDPAGGVQISMRDTVDTALTVSIRSANTSTETLPVLTVGRGERILCTVPATAGATLYAVCGASRIRVTFYGNGTLLKSGGQIKGRLITSGPLL